MICMIRYNSRMKSRIECSKARLRKSVASIIPLTNLSLSHKIQSLNILLDRQQKEEKAQLVPLIVLVPEISVPAVSIGALSDRTALTGRSFLFLRARDRMLA